MTKNLPKRYVTEESVKKALKIESFRNISKDKVMQFASMIPYMDKEVALSVIHQFPTYADFGKEMISQYKQTCDDILSKNHESQSSVVVGYQTILDALSKRIDTCQTEEERKRITEDMIAVADKIAQADEINKKFLLRVFKNVGFTIIGVVAAVGAAIGISSQLGGNEELPEIEEEINSESN